MSNCVISDIIVIIYAKKSGVCKVDVLKKHKNIVFQMIDILIIACSYYIAEMIITDNYYFDNNLNTAILKSSLIGICIYTVILHILKPYTNIKQYEDGNDYFYYIVSCILALVAMIFVKKVSNVELVDSKVIFISYLVVAFLMIAYRIFFNEIVDVKSSEMPSNLLIESKTN